MTAIEDALRTALRARLETYEDPLPPPRYSGTPRTAHRGTARRATAGAIAAAVAIVVIAFGAVRLTGGGQATPPAGLDVAAGPASSIPLANPPVVRLLVEHPSLRAVRVDEVLVPGGAPAGGPGVDGFYMQAFRTSAGFDGPMLWVLTVPPPTSERNDYGFGQGRRLTVQDRDGHIQGEGPGLRLTWPGSDGGGVIITSWGVSQADVVNVADGLRPRLAGWDATVLPGGLAPVVDSPRAAGQLAGDGRRVESTYRGDSGRMVELSVSDAGPVSFEDRAMGISTARSVESVTVAGRPGLMIEAGGAGSRRSVLWQPTATTIAELRVGRATADDVVSRDDVLVLVASTRLVDDEVWLSSLPPSTVRPEDVRTTASMLSQGTPLPQGSTWPSTIMAPAARDRASLATEMLNQALCAWERDWLTAMGGADQRRADAALAALDGSHSWAVAAAADRGSTQFRATYIGDLLHAGDVPRAEEHVARTCR